MVRGKTKEKIMSEVVVGIKETKEVLAALNKIVIKLAPVFIDGLQLSDVAAGFAALNNDPLAKAEIEAALADIKAVPSELKDINLSEGVELAMLQVQQLPALIAAFKKVA
jgi:hypothetical protein